MATKSVIRAAAALLMFGTVAGFGASTAAAGPDFPAAVEQVLMRQQEGPLSRLSEDKKLELIACVNDVLAQLPNGRKRYVIEAASYDELEDRFGQVVMENHAEWKQKIARGCAHIVLRV
jgi:hypothetical protein